MMQHIYIDYETFSSVDLKVCGLRRYTASRDFEIMLCAIGRWVDGKPSVQVYDITFTGFPEDIKALLLDDQVIKHAWNAQFERVCTEQLFGVKLNIGSWQCTMAKALYCGLPGSLNECGKVLEIDNVKLAAEGKKLIKKFCIPRKPTKRDPRDRHRSSDLDCMMEWQDFMNYNKVDVLAEMDIEAALECFEFPEREQKLYILDQVINERGIGVDRDFALRADAMHEVYKEFKKAELEDLSGLCDGGSVAQIKEWLVQWCIPIPTKIDKATGKKVETLDKAAVKELLTDPTLPSTVKDLLAGRQQMGKSSNAKYAAMVNTVSGDGRIRGLFQYYGANRTGRWAGRLVQLHNLPQNHIEHLDAARWLVHNFDGNIIPMEWIFGNTPSILSQLIRTAFVAPEGKTFAVADFSAIEARVTAWYAGEQWRLDVFNTHGKIYEASAAAMFNVPIESVTKENGLRDKGKVAELAFGFGGAVQAAKNFGADKMGLSEDDLAQLVKDWRKASPNIVKFWNACHTAALDAMGYPCDVGMPGKGISPRLFPNTVIYRLETNGKFKWLTCELPSGRKLYYFKPHKVPPRFGNGDCLAYWSADNTKTYVPTSTFGGKLCENIVQATARDLLAEKMLDLDEAGYYIVLHVHDEAVAEVPAIAGSEKHALKEMCDIMGVEVSWAPGLPLNAAGYVTPYYKKD